MSNHSDNSFSKLFLGLAVTAAICSSGAGARAAGMNGDSVTVSLRGLDLHTGAGRAALGLLVRKAANHVCTEQDPSGYASGDTLAECVDEAIRDARPQVNRLIALADRPAMVASAFVPAK